MIIFPGNGIFHTRYVELAQTIQRETDLKLWVAIPGETGGISNPFTEQQTIGRSIDKLISRGMKENSRYFLAGHSSGGVIIQKELDNTNNNQLQGLILLGSFIKRNNYQIDPSGLFQISS